MRISATHVVKVSGAVCSRRVRRDHTPGPGMFWDPLRQPSPTNDGRSTPPGEGPGGRRTRSPVVGLNVLFCPSVRPWESPFPQSGCLPQATNTELTTSQVCQTRSEAWKTKPSPGVAGTQGPGPPQALCKRRGIQMLILPILMDAEVGASGRIVFDNPPGLGNDSSEA